MKILFVINSLVAGGAEKVFTDLIKNIDIPGFDITVLSVDDWGIYVEEVKKHAVYKSVIKHAASPPVKKCFLGGISAVWWKLIKYLPPTWLYRWFVKDDYDIEIAYIEGMATKIIAGSDNKHSVKYAWVHTDMINNRWTDQYYKSEKEEYDCYQNIDKVIAVSDDVKKMTEIKYHVTARVMYNALDENNIRTLSSSRRRKLVKKAKLSLISIGTLWEVKGYLRLLEVIKELKEEDYSVELHLIGDGEDREKIQSYVTEHKLENNVILYGFQREPYDFLAQSDLYVCSSFSEGFSTCVTEALILGLPVLTTQCSGMTELLGESEFGLIVENSKDGLMQGIKKMLDEPEILELYRKKALIRGAQFEIKARVQQMKEMFQDDMKNKGK